ncbi:hypothetical protein [Bradyrhizobium septentrionale]|uniref:hypothetical protein n=1 Tax=Bradyrhizobium septentrionale TaxID=1404411 RepID=UPI003BAE39C6
MKIGRWQESSSDGRRVASRSGSPLSSKRKEEAMINLKALGAVAITASALSSSAALAQAALSNPDACQAEFANCTGLGTGSTPTGGYRYRQSTPRTAYRQPPAAGATVGGWGNSYAMSGETGWHGNWNAYAASNGIVCRPGTYFKGADGLRHPCQ